MNMKNLIICIALLFSCLIVRSQTASEILKFNVVSATPCKIGDNEIIGETRFFKENQASIVFSGGIVVVIDKVNDLDLTFIITDKYYRNGAAVFETKDIKNGDIALVIVTEEDSIYTISFIDSKTSLGFIYKTHLME